MSDLERDLREVLHEDAGRVGTPASPPEGLRRSARRRQAVFGGVVGLSALAIVAGVVAGATLLLPAERSVPAVEPVTSGTLNGITITYPRSWVLIDPDAEELNGPRPATDLPRIVLALAPSDPGDSFGCPGLAVGATPAFLMTVQEMPHARAGKGSAPWPVSLEPFGVDGSESACYPGWEFLAAVWTAEGRSFDARIGLSPDATEEEREALFAAFESMTFEPSTEDTGSVVLSTGTAGGDEWQLIATRQVDGLALSLEAESFGTGTGGYDPSSDELRLTTFVIGDDERAVRIVFGAVPAAAVGVRYEVSGEGPDPGPPPEIFDVPDEIDPSLNAFLFTIGEGQVATVEAVDASGAVIASGDTKAVDEPVETPLPTIPIEVQPEQGGVSWGLYLSVEASIDDARIARAVATAEGLGYTPSSGDLSCDEGAAAELGVPADWSRVAVYFATRDDAEEAYMVALQSEGEPVGIARVTTYCLD